MRERERDAIDAAGRIRPVIRREREGEGEGERKIEREAFLIIVDIPFV